MSRIKELLDLVTAHDRIEYALNKARQNCPTGHVRASYGVSIQRQVTGDAISLAILFLSARAEAVLVLYAQELAAQDVQIQLLRRSPLFRPRQKVLAARAMESPATVLRVSCPELVS